MIEIHSEVLIPIVSALFACLGTLGVQWLKSKSETKQAEVSTDLKIEEHRDNLTFQLLKAAKDEVAAARAEVDMLRPLSLHLTHFEEALTHIEHLIVADSDAELRVAKESAVKFLKRVQGLGNMLQTSISASNLKRDLT